MAFQLMPLPYAYDALEPFIDTLTMQIHHDKHHAAYVTNLNAALEKHPELGSKTLEALLSDLNAVPDDIRTAVRNHGGGTWNHNLFWEIMAPKAGGEPEGNLAKAIAGGVRQFRRFQGAVRESCHGTFRFRLGLAGQERRQVEHHFHCQPG